jgi:HPt (histidine-containing phosphotransfer) domain-containing protein
LKFKPIFVEPDLHDLIDVFIRNTIKDYKTIERCIHKLDFDQTRKVCHRILGTAISYGFEDLDTIIKKIQKDAIEEKQVSINENLNILTSHIEFIKEQFSYAEN